LLGLPDADALVSDGGPLGVALDAEELADVLGVGLAECDRDGVTDGVADGRGLA